VALNTVVDKNGRERQIVRGNMPFGAVGIGDVGTYGYSSSPYVTEQMLKSIFLGRGAAAYDRILDSSTAGTGGLFFVPCADLLADPPATAVG
jgi:porphyrinogen peroxidase